jgi:hypothetical protein
MGTLGSQPAREYVHKDLGTFIKEIIKLSKEHAISVESVIEAKKAIELERQNCLSVQNGDYKDEQMGGFGKILERIAEAIENIKS